MRRVRALINVFKLGGLTPSLNTLIKAKSLTNIQIVCMVRSRGGNFCYTDEEYDVMYQDAELLLKNEDDGTVINWNNLNQGLSDEIAKKLNLRIISPSQQKLDEREKKFQEYQNKKEMELLEEKREKEKKEKQRQEKLEEDELWRGLDGYFRFYNDERLHQSLGYKTPASCYLHQKEAA